MVQPVGRGWNLHYRVGFDRRSLGDLGGPGARCRVEMVVRSSVKIFIFEDGGYFADFSVFFFHLVQFFQFWILLDAFGFSALTPQEMI